MNDDNKCLQAMLHMNDEFDIFLARFSKGDVSSSEIQMWCTRLGLSHDELLEFDSDV